MFTTVLLFQQVFKCNPLQSHGHNPLVSSIFTKIDISFVVCVIYWSILTSGSPQEIAWNGPKLVYDCVVWASTVMLLILCPPLLGVYIKLICIVFMECLFKLVNSTAASGWWCNFNHTGDSAVGCKTHFSEKQHWDSKQGKSIFCEVKGHGAQQHTSCRSESVSLEL